MPLPDITQRFVALDEKLNVHDYNFDHFRTKHLVGDVKATLTKRGIAPDETAPDFVLPRADGNGDLRLSDLRDKPILLHFGSFT